MELNELYELTEKENINVLKADLKNLNGCYIHDDKIEPTIILNKYAIEKETIAEELGHHFKSVTPTTPFKGDYYNKLIRSINEFRAFKWYSDKLIPKDKFNMYIDKYKPTSIYELADYFNVSVEYATKVCELYLNLI